MALLITVALALVALQASNVNAQTTYTVTVTIQGLPTSFSTKLYIDGSFNTTLNGGKSLSFIFQTSGTTHWITVDYYVPNNAAPSDGARYYEVDTNWIFNGGGSHVFTYTPQYYLSVTTRFGVATGSGWYESGAKAQVTLNNGEVDAGPGIRQIFSGWGGDASGTGLTSNLIVMEKPKSAVANWKTQFLLTVKSDPQNITNLLGSGWYDSGNQASFSAPAVSPANVDSRLRFDHWSGAYTGQSPSGALTMDAPKVVEADYVAQYLLTIVLDPATVPHSFNATSWYDANSNVQLGPVQAIVQVSSLERFRFVAWIENGKQFSGISVNLYMDHPHALTLSYMTQYFVDVRSTYGPVTGSGWYDNGSTARISAPTTVGFWPFTYTLQSWSVEPSNGSLASEDGAWALKVDRPYTVNAIWSFDVFPTIALILGIAVAIVAAVVLVLAYRRGILTRRLTTLQPQKIRAGTFGPTALCTSCGTKIPKGAVFCQKCGASVVASELSSLEDKVYNYIVSNEGVISLSKASQDLGVSVDDLKRTTESLKKKGRIA